MNRNIPAIVLIVCVSAGSYELAAGPIAADPNPFPFERHVIDKAFENGYQVTVADIDSDGRPDIVALSTTPSDLAWYRNPTWERIPIASRTANNIDVAPYDIDADGDIDLTLAAGFNLGNSLQGGEVFWLACPDDPVATHEWPVRRIDAVPTSHRVRWAELDGDGVKELVNLPIIGVGARAPDYAAGLKFKAYAIPGDPTADAWPVRVIDSTLEMAHGLAVIPSESSNTDELLTASFGGVHVHRAEDGGFAKAQIGTGDRSDRPKQGASEVGKGSIAGADAPFIATIEPWHGHQVVVYTPGPDEALPWSRTVIDDALSDGHALACADLDRDGTDEVIAGCRGAPQCLFIYRYDAAGGKWIRYTLDDGGISAAGIFIADINQDRYPDIVATGTHTNNVVYYENRLGRGIQSARSRTAGN